MMPYSSLPILTQVGILRLLSFEGRNNEPDQHQGSNPRTSKANTSTSTVSLSFPTTWAGQSFVGYLVSTHLTRDQLGHSGSNVERHTDHGNYN